LILFHNFFFSLPFDSFPQFLFFLSVYDTMCVLHLSCFCFEFTFCPLFQPLFFTLASSPAFPPFSLTKSLHIWEQ
jgi:hypothetical protein